MKRKRRAEGPWRSFHVRPEDEHYDVATYYSGAEASRYASSNAMKKIQHNLTLRALELALFPLDWRVLDAGCGAGFSLEVLREAGYKKIAGFDAVLDLLEHAKKKGFAVRLGDLRSIPFPARSFDAILSISALQWLTARNAKENLEKVASEFWRVLKHGGKAVIQFYPRSEEEALEAGKAFRARGFKTTIVTDNPKNPRKRKVFILLSKELTQAFKYRKKH
ncbi:MAG: class I SAM-dependent methyltransferase [Candidatus Micrarchaeia archaeon]